MAKPFGFLGMDFDEFRRKKEKISVDATAANGLTWENALAAASRFSGRRTCSKGQGTKPESKNFQPEAWREGSFNVCFWVNVEGVEQQWVVRFAKPIAERSLIKMKLRSEVATTQFLDQNTRVPVPKVIGYGEGDESIPPFLIMENIDGIRLTLLWGVNVGPSIVSKLLRSLPEIHHELLSHPFDRIGMLDLPSNNGASPVFTTPFSLDALEHCRDGVSPMLYPPFENVSQYYDYKLEIWNRRLREQRNSVDSRADALRKFINADIIREFLRQFSDSSQENGPFYLVHPDIGGNNVIIDPQTWTVKAIIDWEGACTLPIASALSPPRCIHNLKPIDLLPNSNNFQKFQESLELYHHAFYSVGRFLDANRDVEVEHPEVTKHPKWTMPNSLTQGTFCIWAIDDVRDLDQLVWQHIAPELYVELRQGYHGILSEQRAHEMVDASQDGLQTLLSDFVDKLYRSGQYNVGAIDFWVSRKLEDLEAYRDECKVGDLG